MEVHERRHTKIANALRCLSIAGPRLRKIEASGFMHLLGEVRNISNVGSSHDCDLFVGAANETYTMWKFAMPMKIRPWIDLDVKFGEQILWSSVSNNNAKESKLQFVRSYFNPSHLEDRNLLEEQFQFFNILPTHIVCWNMIPPTVRLLSNIRGTF